MSFSKENIKGTISGIILVVIFAVVAVQISSIGFIATLKISPLVIGIIIGIIYGNTLHKYTPDSWGAGITFCGKKILRFAIVFYGFRITFQQIIDIGIEGFLVSLIMLSTTFVLGTFLGYKVFKMDKDTSILVASGAAVCGAAAVLATEPVLKAEPYKTAVAVSMVVLFGTISMFLYPILYSSIIEPASGFFHMSTQEFGIYVGGTIHEVAQVIAVPASVVGAPADMANSAVIVKMIRVIMIAPMLIILGFYLLYQAKKEGTTTNGVKLVIPWFAVYFVGMAGFNSLDILPKNIVEIINQIDTFLLTMAMSALGMGTIFSKFKGLGLAPLYTAGVMLLWLILGGFVVTKLIVNTF